MNDQPADTPLPPDSPASVPPTVLGLDAEKLLAAALQTSPESAPAFAWTPPAPEEIAPWFPEYVIESLAGRGAMGAVYRARQRKLERPVAIKLLPAALAAREGAEARFEREARAMARLNHPNIVTLYDYGRTGGGHLFIVMEFVDGTDLSRIIHGPGLAVPEALQIVSQVCDALQYAHGCGFVHRDIKPGNILVDTAGRVRIADFGLAKLLGQDARQSGATLTGVALGTPDYQAPEQSRGGAVDHRADIYSLGVMLYEMLTGDLPRGAWEPVSKRHPDASPRLDEVVTRALQQEPDKRYQQASEVKTDVEAAGRPEARCPAPAPSRWRPAVPVVLSLAAAGWIASTIHTKDVPRYLVSAGPFVCLAVFYWLRGRRPLGAIGGLLGGLGVAWLVALTLTDLRPLTTPPVPPVADNPRVAALRTALAEQEAQRAVLAGKYLDKHPKMIAADKAIRNLRDSLRAAMDGSPDPSPRPDGEPETKLAALEKLLAERETERAMLSSEYGPKHPKMIGLDFAIRELEERVRREREARSRPDKAAFEDAVDARLQQRHSPAEWKKREEALARLSVEFGPDHPKRIAAQKALDDVLTGLSPAEREAAAAPEPIPDDLQISEVAKEEMSQLLKSLFDAWQSLDDFRKRDPAALATPGEIATEMDDPVPSRASLKALLSYGYSPLHPHVKEAVARFDELEALLKSLEPMPAGQCLTVDRGVENRFSGSPAQTLSTVVPPLPPDEIPIVWKPAADASRPILFMVQVRPSELSYASPPDLWPTGAPQSVQPLPVIAPVSQENLEFIQKTWPTETDANGPGLVVHEFAEGLTEIPWRYWVPWCADAIPWAEGEPAAPAGRAGRVILRGGKCYAVTDDILRPVLRGTLDESEFNRWQDDRIAWQVLPPALAALRRKDGPALDEILQRLHVDSAWAKTLTAADRLLFGKPGEGLKNINEGKLHLSNGCDALYFKLTATAASAVTVAGALQGILPAPATGPALQETAAALGEGVTVHTGYTEGGPVPPVPVTGDATGPVLLRVSGGKPVLLRSQERAEILIEWPPAAPEH